MDCKVTIDCKSILAFFGGVIGVGLLVKLNADAIERISIKVIEAVKEYALVENNER